MLNRAGVPRHAIIKKFAGEEISQLEDLITVLSKLSRGARVPLEYFSYTDRHRSKVFIKSHSVCMGRMNAVFSYMLEKCLYCGLYSRHYGCFSRIMCALVVEANVMILPFR